VYSQSPECRDIPPLNTDIPAAMVRSRDQNGSRKPGEASVAGYASGNTRQTPAMDEVAHRWPGVEPAFQVAANVRCFKTSKALSLPRKNSDVKRREKSLETAEASYFFSYASWVNTGHNNRVDKCGECSKNKGSFPSVIFIAGLCSAVV